MKVYCYVNPGSRATEKLMKSFAKGCNGELVSFNDGHIKDGLIVLRSRSPQANQMVRDCWKTGQDFIFIDTGYFLNSQAKQYHRVTKNHYQNFKIIDRPNDRWEMFQKQGVQMKPWVKDGETILVCPPTDKSMGAYTEIDSASWTEQAVQSLKNLYPHKKIVIRTKPKLNKRRSGDSLEQSLKDNRVWAVASWQGGVAIEAALLGYPSFVHIHNAALPVTQSEWSKGPVYPNRTAWLHSISYDQFTTRDMESGLAFNSVI